MDKLTQQNITTLPAPPGLVLAVCDVANHAADLFPEELASQPNAVPKRLNEFSTGRFLVHALQEHVGNKRTPVLRHSNRSPIWPPGIKGSISHVKRLAAAVLTIDPGFDSVGVDIELLADTAAKLSARLLTTNEIATLEALRATTTQPETLFFSAKEAVYKAIYPLAGQMIEFQEVEITLTPANNTFTAKYLPTLTDSNASNARLSEGQGYYYNIDGHIVTLFVITTA